MTYIKIDGLSKLYSDALPETLKLLQNGVSSKEIQALTGQFVSLNNINLGIAKGEFHVIMGLSGSGKSTLLRHLNCLLKPTLGHLYVNGEDITQFSNTQISQFRQHTVSMVFQNYGLFPHRNVIENIAFGLLVQNDWQHSPEIDEKVHTWIEKVGLNGFEASYPNELSGGMQQRVGLARALATESDILLLDEAFSGLDPLIRHEMQDLLLSLENIKNKTIIFITHDLDEALRLGDKVTILHQGSVAQSDTPINIIRNPANDYVHRFAQHVNRAKVLNASSIQKNFVPISKETSIGEAISKLNKQGSDICFVFDKTAILGVTSLQKLCQADKNKQSMIGEVLDPVETVRDIATLEQVLPLSLQSTYPLAVVDEAGMVKGQLSREDILSSLI